MKLATTDYTGFSVCGCGSCFFFRMVLIFQVASIRGNDTRLTEVGMEES